MHFETATFRVLHDRSINPLPNNLYINCTICIQKLYKTLNLYTKIMQIKILYDDECTKNVHQIPTYIQKMFNLYKTCTKFRLKTA